MVFTCRHNACGVVWVTMGRCHVLCCTSKCTVWTKFNLALLASEAVSKEFKRVGTCVLSARASF